MIWSIPSPTPFAWLPSSSPLGTESLCDLETLESSALLSLMSFKNGSAKRSVPYNDDKKVIASESTSQVASDEESSSSWMPPRKKVIRSKHVSVSVVGTAFTAASAPTSLYAEGDEDYINPIHNIMRRDILEVFVETGPQDRGGNNSTSARSNRFAGRIGLRCRYCKHLPQGSAANLSTIYPETLDGIYRACSVRFQKRHLGSCQYIPKAIRAELDVLGNEKSCRGSKGYWVESALRLGLRTAPDQKGIIFCPEIRSV